MDKSPFELSLERQLQARTESFRADVRASANDLPWASKVADALPPETSPPPSERLKDIDTLVSAAERDAAVIGAFDPNAMTRHILGKSADPDLERAFKARLMRSCRETGARSNPSWMLQAEPRRLHIRRLAEAPSSTRAIEESLRRTAAIASPVEPFTLALRSVLRGAVPHWALERLAPEPVYAAMEFAFPVVPDAPDPKEMRRRLARRELNQVGRNLVALANFPVRNKLNEFIAAECPEGTLPAFQLFGGDPKLRFDFLASMCAASFADHRSDFVLLTLMRPTLEGGEYEALVREIELQLQLQGGYEVRDRESRRRRWDPVEEPGAKGPRLVLLCVRPDELAPAAQTEFTASLWRLQSEYASGRLRPVLSTPTRQPVGDLEATIVEFADVGQIAQRTVVSSVREAIRKRDDSEGGSTPATT